MRTTKRTRSTRTISSRPRPPPLDPFAPHNKPLAVAVVVVIAVVVAVVVAVAVVIIVVIAVAVAVAGA